MALLERGDALDQLQSALDSARTGLGRVVLIRGEAGIGKTALTREFLSAFDDGYVLSGSCDDLLTARPLGPVWDMATDEPALLPHLESDDRPALFMEMIELAKRSMRPTLFVIEDVHWADDATLDLIRFLGRRIGDSHGVLLLTFRDGEVADDHPVRIALGDLPHGSVERIHLTPLSSGAVEMLAGSEDAETLWVMTGGNPFYVTEALASDLDEIPTSISDAVNSRVRRLSPQAQKLVELSSVSPSRVEIAVLESVLGDVVAPLTEVEQAGIMEVDGSTVRFRHELARQAIESQLAGIVRNRLNLQTLNACDALGAPIARLAHHARSAGDAAAIVRLLPEAARTAASIESHAEAVANLRALEPYLHLMTDEDLADHYDLWAYEEYLWDDTGLEIVDKAVELRSRLGDPKALGNSLLSASRIAWVSSDRPTALRRAHEAVEVLSDVGGEPLAMAYSTLSQLAMLANEEEATVEYGQKALSISGDSESRAHAHALNNIGAVWMMNSLPKGVAELEASYEMANRLGLPHDATRAGVNLAWGYLWYRDLERARRWTDIAVSVITNAEMRAFGSYAVTIDALIRSMKGDWDDAADRFREILAQQAILSTSRATATMALAKLMVRRGAPDAAALVADSTELARAAGEIQREAPAAEVVAEFAWLGGEVEEADLTACEEVMHRTFAHGGAWNGGEVAMWLWLLGRLGSMPIDAPEPYQLLASGDWKAAAAWWAERGIPYDRAVALSLGDTEARLEALDILDELDATPLASRIRSELVESGVKGVPRGPKRSTRENPLGLTARQGDVLHLLAEDLTNPEIADRLFISTRTVDHHVSAILARLGASDRQAAVANARAQGVVA